MRQAGFDRRRAKQGKRALHLTCPSTTALMQREGGNVADVQAGHVPMLLLLLLLLRVAWALPGQACGGQMKMQPVGRGVEGRRARRFIGCACRSGCCRR
jgi:hypothetical protein